jgi:O-Antigen ligase
MKKLRFAGLMFVVLLFVVWPIAHVTSARELLLFLSLFLFGWVAYRQRVRGWVAPLAVPLGLYAALTVWMLVVAFAISPEPAWTLGEIRGQWLKGLAALLVGLWMGAAIANDERTTARALSAFALIGAAYVIYVDFIALGGLVQTGSVLQRFPVFGGGPDKANYVTNLFLVFLFAEGFQRLTGMGRVLRIGNAVLVLFVVAGLLAEYATGMRNGVAEVGISLLVLAVLFIRSNRQRAAFPALLGGAAVSVAIVGALAYLNYQSDPRWRTFEETAAIAWDTNTHKSWLNEQKYPLPRLRDGNFVDGSAYERITCIKEGGRLVLDHPLGIGFGRNAYGHGLKAKFGEGGLGHSHSGIIDLAIGTGFPGALLWLAFVGSLIIVGWRRFAAAPDYPPLLLLLVATGYGSRMLVDSIIRDHMLQQFLFLAGLLAALSVLRAERAPP